MASPSKNMNLNKVIIIGRMTANPEMRTLQSGGEVTNFSVATSRKWKDKDGKQTEETEFHRVVAFGRTAQVICQYCVKGSLLALEGRLRTRTWDDKQGVKHYTTEVIAEAIQLGPRPTPRQAEQEQKVDSKKQEDTADESLGGGEEDIKAEDLPF